MSPTEKKKKKKKKKKRLHKKKSSLVLPQTPQFSSLPHELVVSCLARVSKSYYPTLSLVSKSFRSLLASPELYKIRSLLNCTESFLYVCLNFFPDRWFTLCRRHNRTLINDARKKKKKPMRNILVQIPSPSSPAEAYSSSCVVVGSDIYEIGGHINGVPSSSVSVLDCRSNTWHKAPNMWEKREDPSANVIDGKIYVAGGLENYDFLGWIEVFDPKTQTWEHVSSPGTEIYESEVKETVVIEGKLYTYGSKDVSYNPKDGTCEPVKWMNSPCVIDNVLFCYNSYERVLKWYDTKVRDWRNLKGLKGLPKFPTGTDVRLVDYGGKMVVLWCEHAYDHGYNMRSTRILCAEITLERCNNEEEISGKVMWFDPVLGVPHYCEIVSVLAAIV